MHVLSLFEILRDGYDQEILKTFWADPTYYNRLLSAQSLEKTESLTSSLKLQPITGLVVPTWFFLYCSFNAQLSFEEPHVVLPF